MEKLILINGRYWLVLEEETGYDTWCELATLQTVWAQAMGAMPELA